MFALHKPTVSSSFAFTASPERKRFSTPLPASSLRFATSPQVDQTKWSANLSGFVETIGLWPMYGAFGPATLNPRSKTWTRFVNVRPSSKVMYGCTAVVHPEDELNVLYFGALRAGVGTCHSCKHLENVVSVSLNGSGHSKGRTGMPWLS